MDIKVASEKNFGDSNINRKKFVESGENEVESDTQGVRLITISNQPFQDYNPVINYEQ